MRTLRALSRSRKGGLLLSLLMVPPLSAAGPAHAPEHYFIVVTGGELLRGVYPDGHTWYLARALRPLGLECVGSICVGDEADDLKQALAVAGSRAPLVIVTGGLGPTDDDITRETVSSFTGIPLRENPDVIGVLARRFGGDERGLPANIRRQARTPVAGRFLPNPSGTAVGLVFDDLARVVVALPGPPRELRPMVRDALIPWLQQRFGLRTFGSSALVRFVGIGESKIDQTLHEKVVLPADLVISSIFEAGRVDVSFFLPGSAAADQARMAELVDAVRVQLGDRIYDTAGLTLEDVVLERLSSLGRRLLLAEIGTGGAVGVSLNRSPGAGPAVAGGWVASDRRDLLELASVVVPAAGDGGPRGVGEGAFAKALAEAIAPRVPGGIALVTDQGGEAVDAGGPRPFWAAFGPWHGEVVARRFAIRGEAPDDQALLVTAVLDWMRGIVGTSASLGMPGMGGLSEPEAAPELRPGR